MYSFSLIPKNVTDCKIALLDQELEVVDPIKYMGSTIDKGVEMSEEIMESVIKGR